VALSKGQITGIGRICAAGKPMDLTSAALVSGRRGATAGPVDPLAKIGAARRRPHE
jgi:hypothetical protein